MSDLSRMFFTSADNKTNSMFSMKACDASLLPEPFFIVQQIRSCAYYQYMQLHSRHQRLERRSHHRHTSGSFKHYIPNKYKTCLKQCVIIISNQ
ncbi:hypothetical protein Hanom_Chr04g00321691 [Helianthus anomalus]